MSDQCKKWADHRWVKFNYCTVRCSECGEAETAVNIVGDLQAEIIRLKEDAEDMKEHLRLLDQYPEDLDALRSCQGDNSNE